MQGVKVIDGDWAGAIREALRRKGEPVNTIEVILTRPTEEIENYEKQNNPQA